MNRFFFLSTALFIATGVTGAATISQHAYAGSGTSCEHYSGHASVEAKWGSERSMTETAAFIPLACGEDRLLYGDVRLKGDNRGNREGNVGVGVRALKDKGVAGGYVYLDRRRSGATEKLFTQTTLGTE
jgi:trimeric autotransporter adhesin